MPTSNLPQLPPTEDSEANSLRYEVNPAIALNVLTDIYQQVQHYQIQLRQLAQNIHQVYAEGPVVSGWLASEASLHAAVKYSKLPGDDPRGQAACCDDQSQKLPLEAMDVALFRHGDANDLMNYLSALERTMLERGTSNGELASNGSSNGSANGDGSSNGSNGNGSNGNGSRTATGAPANPTSTISANPSQYYLCRLSSSGQIQAEPCPPDQVPVLSMAIARYRRLKQFIKQKQVIETKLQAIVDILGDIQTVLAD